METQCRADKVIEVVERLAKELNPQQAQELGPGTHLEWDLGLGSIERHELLLRLESGLGETLSSRAVFEATTVSDLLKLTPGSHPKAQKQVMIQSLGEVPPHPAHCTDLLEALLYQCEHQPTRKTLYFQEEEIGRASCRERVFRSV